MKSVVNCHVEPMKDVLSYVLMEDISSAAWLSKQKVLYNNLSMFKKILIHIPVLNVVIVCWPPDEEESNCILLFRWLS